MINSKQVKIAKRYATALSGLDEKELVFSELLSVRNTLNDSADLRTFLENPIVSNIDKKDVINKVFADFNVKTLNFLSVLVDKNRFLYFDSILQELQNDLDVINNVKRVEVISAVPLTDDEMFKLKDILQRKLSSVVEPSYLVDETIIAGLILKIGDKVIDNSLKTRFSSMKRQLI